MKIEDTPDYKDDDSDKYSRRIAEGNALKKIAALYYKGRFEDTVSKLFGKQIEVIAEWKQNCK